MAYADALGSHASVFLMTSDTAIDEGEAVNLMAWIRDNALSS